MGMQVRFEADKIYRAGESGIAVWQTGHRIEPVRVFRDSLPPNLVLPPGYVFPENSTPDCHSRRRYLTSDVRLTVESDALRMIALKVSRVKMEEIPGTDVLMSYHQLSKGGLELILVHLYKEYQGRLSYIP